VIALGRMLQDEAFADGAGAAIAADAISELIALEVLRAEAPRFRSLPRSPGIRRALERIESDCSEALGIEALAKDAGMSRYHFSRRFHQEVGQSPYAYLTGVRLQCAAELLHRGASTVAEAAFSAGFSDLGRFGRKFKARFGCTPSVYATQRGARIAPRIATSA
jgi:AraC-like DNA-binding protein